MSIYKIKNVFARTIVAWGIALVMSALIAIGIPIVFVNGGWLATKDSLRDWPWRSLGKAMVGR